MCNSFYIICKNPAINLNTESQKMCFSKAFCRSLSEQTISESYNLKYDFIITEWIFKLRVHIKKEL